MSPNKQNLDKIKKLNDDTVEVEVEVPEVSLPWKQEDEEVSEIELEEIEEETIESYVQLAKLLSSEEVVDINEIVEILNKASFQEDQEVMYGGRPAKIHYKQLPIIETDEILVKIVILTQADSLALIIPEHVSEVYEELKNDPAQIVKVNKELNIYAEVYRFESKDPDFHEAVKSAYLKAGDGLRAFDIPKELEDKVMGQEEDEDGEPFEAETGSTDNFDSMFGGESGGGSGTDDFEELDSNFDSVGEFEENAKAYEGFRKHSDVLDELKESLYNKVTDQVRPHIKTTYVTESNALLVIEVDNRSIYNKYSKVPKVAKRVMTAVGETIRRNQYTQLIDSFINEGKRYFIIAEAIGNNFWISEADELKRIEEAGKSTVLPIQEEIIILKKSSVREESRTLRPFILNDQIVFK